MVVEGIKENKILKDVESYCGYFIFDIWYGIFIGIIF